MTKIEIETIEIKTGIATILDEIVSTRKASELKKTHLIKFDTWIDNLNQLLFQISKIEEIVLPLMKKDLKYSFENKNLIMTAMVQASLKNTTNEIKVHFNNEPRFEILKEDLNKLGATSDTAKSLAWIGDTTIKYALLMKIWRTGITTEELHNKRQALENNENLSKLSEKWKLFDYRIHFDPENPKDKTKQTIEGTLTEAIFGVIFIEREMKGVQDAIDLIYP